MKDTFDLQNPWRNPSYRFSGRKTIHRLLFDVLLEDLDQRVVTVIVGSRQVGKTFLMKKLIEILLNEKGCSPAQIFYFNFDAIELVEFVANDRDFLDFIAHYGIKGQKSFIFFDEAQRIPNIGLILKRYHDLERNLKFIVSGSSSLEIKSQVKETLTGRKHLFELYPISFGEFLRFKGLRTPDEPANLVRFESEGYSRALDDFIIYGGYPGVAILDRKEEKVRLLKEIYRSYVHKDVSDFFKIEDIPGFNRLVQFLSQQSGGLCKFNEVAKNTRLTRYFVEAYLFALQETYVVQLLLPYFVNLGKAIVKTPKLYFCDTGIRNAVFGQFGTLAQRRDSGLLVENFVFSELIKAIDRERIWFYRTTAGSEVDFVVDRGDHVVPVEVKYSASRQKTVPKIFATLANHAGIKKALVATRNYADDTERYGARILFRPSYTLYSIQKLL